MGGQRYGIQHAQGVLIVGKFFLNRIQAHFHILKVGQLLPGVFLPLPKIDQLFFLLGKFKGDQQGQQGDQYKQKPSGQAKQVPHEEHGTEHPGFQPHGAADEGRQAAANQEPDDAP